MKQFVKGFIVAVLFMITLISIIANWVGWQALRAFYDVYVRRERDSTGRRRSSYYTTYNKEV